MIIGLYGDSRAGKDTVARRIAHKHGYEWRSFAIILRELLYEINPIIGGESDVNEEVYYMRYQRAIQEYGLDGTKKLFPESVDLMIRLGQGARDILGEDVWASRVLEDLGGDEKVVISDVRQPNEYDGIIARGGQVWHIVKAGTTRKAMDGLLDDRHFHVVLHNNSSVDDLHDQVDREIHAL